MFERAESVSGAREIAGSEFVKRDARSYEWL